MRRASTRLPPPPAWNASCARSTQRGSGIRVEGPGLGVRVQAPGFWVLGSGFGVEGAFRMRGQGQQQRRWSSIPHNCHTCWTHLRGQRPQTPAPCPFLCSAATTPGGILLHLPRICDHLPSEQPHTFASCVASAPNTRFMSSVVLRSDDPCAGSSSTSTASSFFTWSKFWIVLRACEECGQECGQTMHSRSSCGLRQHV
eukprot:193240-Chlamydomonas_euryale.AAC.1